MEEIKKKKKLNKKPLLICLAIALVFAVIGFIDIKSNAAEKYTVNVTFDRTTGTENKATNVITFYSISPMQVYVYTSHDVPASQIEKIWGYAFVVSDSRIDDVGAISSEKYTKNGKDFYVMMYNLSFGPYDFSPNQYYNVYSDGGKDIRLKTQYATAYDFAQAYINDSLDVVIDYSSFETDYDMPVPENIKRNIVVEDAWDSFTNTWYVDNSYEYLLWKNTSDLKIQIQTLPVVQYFEEKLGRVNFSQQFHGNTWNDSQILDVGVCNYTIQTDIDFIKENAKSDYEFYRLCLDTKSLTLFEKSYFFYAYRLRYVDETNEVAGPWLCVYPNEILNGTNTFIIDSSGEITNSDSNMGEVVEKPLGESTLDETLKDIDNTLEFKDKYEIVDGDVDTQEATNWLYSVVNFIKGTPQVVGSVLAFLPQPILYGMYVCIFLGIIASGLAIVKALL